jgi:hypothetical protein
VTDEEEEEVDEVVLVVVVVPEIIPSIHARLAATPV